MNEVNKLDSSYTLCGSCEARFYTGGRIQKYCDDCQKARTKLVVSKIESETIQFIETQVVNVIKHKKKIFFFRWMLIWFLIGASFAFYKRNENEKGCVYRSIGSFINPGYLLGCEMFRERWEIGK